VRRPSAVRFLLVVCCCAGARLGALELRQGLIRLDIHESTGRFSLYYLTDPASDLYEPLFTHQDPRTSFLAVSVNGRVYRLGEAPVFSIRVDSSRPLAPAIVFQSPFLLVRQEFLFIKTPGSAEVNGVKMAVHFENRDVQEAALGLRVLIDTSLGETHGEIPFETDRQRISAETGIAREARDQWWISRNSRLSLIGSILVGQDKKPDFIHFANWKRLNDMPWKIGYNSGRNFNYPPYSMGDSAVCYYYDPAPLKSRQRVSYGIFLAGGETSGFGFAPPSPTMLQRNGDIELLHTMLRRLDQYLLGEASISAEELAEIESSIGQIKTRYNLP
jgi:hypothetical protein